jgi:hypothetical protein
MASREFRNRLHEQLARRTARDAFRGVSANGEPVSVSCDPCEQEFSSSSEDNLREDLVTHYKTAEHRMATQLPMHKQRSAN